MKKWMIGLIVGMAVVALAGCDDTPQPSNVDKAQQQVAAHQAARDIYVMKNDIEFNNYNGRQKISDDPTTILWCTTAFPIPGSPLFTVPIVGKVTSGSKRPYPTSQVIYEGTYNPEIAGPDGMYGPSEDYRYGFTPTGQYVDFYNMSTFCTTEPMIWQRETTKVVMEIDPSLAAAQAKARELLREGIQNPTRKAEYDDQARQILQNAIGAGK